jgi:hypothetical protein
VSRYELSAAIMTHPSRLANALELRDRLLPDIDAQVFVDPEPDGPPRALRSARLAWGAAGGSASHHLVLQDDVYPCTSFAVHVARVVKTDPDAAVSLFANWYSDTGFLMRTASLLGLASVPVADVYMPTQALVAPVAVAATIADHLGRATPEEHDDVIILDCLRDLGTRHLAAVPSLVQHDDLPSISLNGRRCFRPAAVFSDPPIIPLETSMLSPSAIAPCYQARARRAAIRFYRVRGAAMIPSGTIGIPPLFESLQAPTEEIEAAYRRELARQRGAKRPAAKLFDSHREPDFHAAYLVAVAIAIHAAKKYGGSAEDLLSRLGDDAVRVAFSTQMPGVLRWKWPIDLLLPCRDALGESALDAVATGLSISGRCADWPSKVPVTAA